MSPMPDFSTRWAQPGKTGVEPDRRHHHLVVDELLDALQGRLAPLRVELVRLLLEEAVDIRVAAVGVGPAPTMKASSLVAALPKAPLAPWISPLYFRSDQPLK